MSEFRLASLGVLLVLLLASSSPAYADTKTLTADASYIEEAGTYVQSYTKSVNQDLTKDEIQTLTGGVMQVEVLEKARRLVADGLRFFPQPNATFDADIVAS